MKSLSITSLIGAALAVLAAAPASAQPGATPPTGAGSNAGSGAGSNAGSGAGSNAGSNAGSGADAGSNAPSWLPGLPGGDTNDLSSITVNANGTVTLTMDQAVAIAIKQQPSLKIATANIEAAYGRVDQARAVLHPTLTLAGTLGASTSAVRTCGGYNPVTMMQDTTGQCTGGFFDPTGSTGVSATGSWRITDFGATRATIRANEETADGQIASLDSSRLDVRLSVESAYLQAVAYQRLVVVAESTLKSTDGHLDQAKRFVAAGQQDPITVAQAQAAESNAKSALALSKSNYAVALSTLRSAIGWIDPKQAPIVDPHWPIPPDEDPAELPALVELARQHRPDIAADDRLIEAGKDAVIAADYEHRPVLSATATVGWQPNTSAINEPAWSAGITLSWLAFSGGKIDADVRVADANLAIASANRDALLVTLTSQLEGARSQIASNREAVSAANEAVVAARQQLHLSDARYAQGIGSQIELADAETAVTTAEGSLVQSQYQLALAWAQLHRYLGQQ